MRPDKLSLFIGGYGGTSYSVELKRGALQYRVMEDRPENERKYTVRPSPEAWTEFWRRLDEIGVWSWEGTYQTPYICDGTSWSVSLSVGERVVEAHGSNAYPASSSKKRDSKSPCEPESRFQAFCEAVSDLIGGREFC